MANIVHTICSGCSEDVRVDIDGGVATMRVPSNGQRGSLRIAAHDVTADVVVGDILAGWDCPRCGYADSVYATADLRKALA